MSIHYPIPFKANAARPARHFLRQDDPLPQAQNRVVVSHRGDTIVFATLSGDLDAQAVHYTILRVGPDGDDGGAAWSGYQPLDVPPQVAPAGMSLVRVELDVAASGLMQAVSDGQYVYLFRACEDANKGAIYVSRYVVVDVPSDSARGKTLPALQPAWEVRYQLSASPDLPANDKDTLGARSPDGVPFLEPIHELPISSDGVDFGQASFAVLLEPTAEEATFRWQLFVPRIDGTVASYSLGRTGNGWFAIDRQRLDPGTGALRPDAVVKLTGKRGALAACGPLSAANYLKQEAVATSAGDTIKTRRNNRVLLTVPVSDNGATRVATLDFAVATDGTLSGLYGDASLDVTYALEDIEPAGSVLAFDGKSRCDLPGGDYMVSDSFTLEAWIQPQDAALEPQVLLGGTKPASSDLGPSPSLFVTEQRKLGVAWWLDDKQYNLVSVDSVLTLGTWSHVAAVRQPGDASPPALYVNGTAVVTTAPSESLLLQPGAVTSIGAIGLAGADSASQFTGLVDELRVWSVPRSPDELAKYMFEEIPEVVAKELTQLAGYWRLDDGEGTTATDLSLYHRDATLQGPTWQPTSSPMHSRADGSLYYDARGLTTFVGLLAPVEDRPLFGDLLAGTRTSLLYSADGLVRMYYACGAPQAPGAFCVAHYDSSIDRAGYALPWVAGDDPADQQAGSLLLLARQSGSALNRAEIVARADETPGLLALTLQDQPANGTTEVWRGLPCEASRLADVLGGLASAEPAAAAASNKTFYDVAGTRPLALVDGALAGIDSPAQLWLASVRIGDYQLRQVEFAHTGSETGTLTVSIASDAAHPTQTLRRSVDGVPLAIDGFLRTIAGGSGSAQVAAGLGVGDTAVYGLATSTMPFGIVVPAESGLLIAAAGISLAQDQTCDLSITVELAGASRESFTWPGLPRDTSAFAAALSQIKDDVLDKIRLMPPMTPGQMLACEVDTDSGVQAFLGLLQPVNQGWRGPVPAFSIEASLRQGATSTRAEADLSRGSNLFLPQMQGQPTNGHAAVIELSGEITTASLVQAGHDGGWISEPPQYAVQVDGACMGARVDGQNIGALEMPAEFTLEAWMQASAVSPLDHDVGFPRLLEANLAEGQSRYALGLAPTKAFDPPGGTFMRVSDTNAMAPPPLRLMPEEGYTVQFYFRYLSSTTRVSYREVFRHEVADSLIVEYFDLQRESSLHILVFGATLQNGSGSQDRFYMLDEYFADRWLQITIVRTQSQVHLYVNGKREFTRPCEPWTEQQVNTIQMGERRLDNDTPFNMAQFTLYRGAMTPEEIASSGFQPTNPSDPRLQVYYPFDMAPGQPQGPIVNKAQTTGAYYDTVIIDPGQSNFCNNGPFHRPFFCAHGQGVQARDAVVNERQWHQLAAHYQPCTGLKLDNSHYGDCGTDASMDMRTALSIEAWLWPKSADSARSVVSRFGETEDTRSYELGLDSENRPYLSLHVIERDSQGNVSNKLMRLETFVAPKPLSTTQGSYVVATAFVLTTTDPTTGDVSYSLRAQIYVNGEPVLDGQPTSAVSDPIEIATTTLPLTLGCASNAKGERRMFYEGGLANVRLWRAELDAAAVRAAYVTRDSGGDQDNLVSWWPFSEGSGRVAHDAHATNDATLSDSRMWTNFAEGSRLALLVDGQPVPTEWVDATRFGESNTAQFSVGGTDRGDTLPGRIDEVRVWSTTRTAQQIRENMNRYLAGNEPGLAGYWSFNNGAGPNVVDGTGRGNDLAAPGNELPHWFESSAPISNEAPVVRNALSDRTTDYVRTIVEGPQVFEYAAIEFDAYAQPHSVLRRGYCYRTEDDAQTLTGYKVGDLSLVYVGQVQTQPTLVGYVEGAPPLPSENLTRPYYLDPIDGYSQYEEIASVTLSESTGTTVRVTGARQDSTSVNGSFAGGISADDKVYAGVDVPAVAVIMYQTVKAQGKAGVKNEDDWSRDSSSGHELTDETNRSRTLCISNGGEWELPSETLLNSHERRYVPDNLGCALVKSGTANLYAQVLQSTGALYGLTVVPDPDVPIDVNLIHFPIDPSYVRNGSLDGRVGLQDDPECGGAPSYYRPHEAYELQRRIEQETAQVEAQYDQVSAPGRAQAQKDDIGDLVDKDALRDWSAGVPRKDMMNKYVWTAGGGFYAEQEDYASERQESFGGGFDFSWRVGAQGSLDVDVGPVGLFFELDMMAGQGWTVTVDKEKTERSAISLDVELRPERMLSRYLSGNTVTPFARQPEPGKVDGYRFASFYLAPTKGNTQTFFDKVVDAVWFATSSDFAAVALRQAQATSSGTSSWRLLHRVTYVSRVPPAFQPVPVVSDDKPVSLPANLDANALALELVTANLPEGTTPTPVQIAKAVTQVLREDLKNELPWWEDFLEKAAAANSPSAIAFNALNDGFNRYVQQYYAADGTSRAA